MRLQAHAQVSRRWKCTHRMTSTASFEQQPVTPHTEANVYGFSSALFLSKSLGKLLQLVEGGAHTSKMMLSIALSEASDALSEVAVAFTQYKSSPTITWQA